MTTRTTAAPGRSIGGPLEPAVRPGARSSRRWTRNLVPYLFIGPAVLYLGLFMLTPLFRGIGLSFTDTFLVNPEGGSWIGLDNYSYLLSGDAFWQSLWATVLYTVVTVVVSVTLGTAAAIAINRPFRGRSVARAIMTFPWAVPTVAAALIFTWIYNQQSGVLNNASQVLGIGERGWLVDPDYGMFAVLLATVWKVFPLVMLVVLASLQSVPDELYEATRIDGADGLSTFRAVVLPHIMPAIRVVSLLMTIWSIRRFEIIYLLTGGGPVDRTNTLVVNVYRQAFSDQELGRAAAIGVLGLLLSLLVTVVYFLVERRQSRKEG